MPVGHAPLHRDDAGEAPAMRLTSRPITASPTMPVELGLDVELPLLALLDLFRADSPARREA